MEEFKVFKDFTGKDILADALKFHKSITGKELPVCSEEYYIYSTTAHLLEMISAAMEDEAKQNFIRYAKGVRLDLKGEMYGSRGKRIEGNYARTTMRCTTSIQVPHDVTIPKGTRFIYKNYIFYTEKDYLITKNSNYIDVVVVTDTIGNIGNIGIGEVTDIVDKYEFYESCQNITIVTGGEDREIDLLYKKRLQLLPESFTTAGAARAYEYWASKASNLVSDMYIDTPSPNYIDIYVINNQKALSTEEKEKIKKYLEQDHIKALNDQITIKDPKINNYNIDIEYWIYDNSKITKTEIENKLKSKLEEYTKQYKLGDSINTQDYIEIAKSIEGIKKVKIIAPVDKNGEKKEINVCTSIQVTYKGAEEK